MTVDGGDGCRIECLIRSRATCDRLDLAMGSRKEGKKRVGIFTSHGDLGTVLRRPLLLLSTSGEVRGSGKKVENCQKDKVDVFRHTTKTLDAAL